MTAPPAPPTLPAEPTPTPPLPAEPTPAAPPRPTESFTLRWDAPRDCPTQAVLAEQISTLIADPTAGREVLAEIELHRRATGFAGTLALRTPWGTSTRELQAERCETVAEATALLIAIAIDPLATEQALERIDDAPTESPPNEAGPEDEPEVPGLVPTTASDSVVAPVTSEQRGGPARTSATEAPSSDPPTEPPTEPPPRTHQGFVRLEAGGGLGPFPQAGVTLAGAIGYRTRWLRVGAHARYWIPQRVNHPLDSAVAADLSLWGAGAHGCAGPRWNEIELPV